MHKSSTSQWISIAELMDDPEAFLDVLDIGTIAIVDRNMPVAYLLSTEAFEAMMEMLDDYALGALVRKRLGEDGEVMGVDIDGL